MLVYVYILLGSFAAVPMYVVYCCVPGSQQPKFGMAVWFGAVHCWFCYTYVVGCSACGAVVWFGILQSTYYNLALHAVLLEQSSQNFGISAYVWLCAFIIVRIWCYCMVWFRPPVGTTVCNLVQAINGVGIPLQFTMHEVS